MKKNIKENIKNILIIQTAFLGDIVLTIPLINTIKKNYPQARLTILTTPIGKKILEGQYSIDHIIEYDKNGYEKGFSSFRAFIKLIQEYKFDWAVLPHRSLRSALLVWFAGIPRRWGYDRSEGRWFLTKKIKYKYGIHEIERNFDLVRDVCGSFDTTIKFPDYDSVSDIKKNVKAGRKIIGVHPGSVWATKRWPLEYFIELIKKLVNDGRVAVVFGDKSDNAISNEIEKTFKDAPNVINLIGKTNIKELIGSIRDLSCYVSNDSGPMHIAAALKIPQIAIFGPTVKKFGFFPYSENAKVLELDIDCRPCSPHGTSKCPKKHFRCMRDITPDMVYDEYLKKIAILKAE
ncbi:MAG: lipopolysaccharide heptosyltransferase II [Elusimicrobiota bacterium]